MRLLLIEDDVKIVAFVTKGLRQAGFAVDHAANGEEGLNMALAEPYDCLLVDVMLPKLEGLEVIRELRSRKVNVPVLILSAKRSVEDRVRGLYSGSDDYLAKLLAFSELMARVQALLRRASGATEPSSLVAGDLELDLLTHEVSRAGMAIDLQPREFALLEYLMRNAGGSYRGR